MQWIKVSEKKPSPDQEVIGCCTKNVKYNDIVTSMTYYACKRHEKNDCGHDYFMVHGNTVYSEDIGYWMPFPEPPKG